MKEIIAVIRMRMMQPTKQALAEAGISSVTAKDVLGRGQSRVVEALHADAEKGIEDTVMRLNPRLIAKRVLFITVPDKLVARTVKTIIKANQTGESGDGKIFVLPVLDAVRVRTGESGDLALDEV